MNTEEMFWANVKKARNCWYWQGKLYKGYGTFCFKGVSRFASRWAYIFVKGAIPEGLHIDHLCRNRSCVNPEHLEAVTNAENRRRGLMGVLKTKCPKGHPWVETNLYRRSDNSLSCRQCRRGYFKTYYSKNTDKINKQRRLTRLT